MTILNASERRDRIIKILILRRHTTVGELAEELEVSGRTIIRDIDILSTSKPIYTIGGRGGGVYIVDGYNVDRIYMKEYETRLLKKIIAETEQFDICKLNLPEILLLKEIVAFYSEPKYEKGKIK